MLRVLSLRIEKMSLCVCVCMCNATGRCVAAHGSTFTMQGSHRHLDLSLQVVNNFHDTGRTRYIDATGSPALMESAAARHMPLGWIREGVQRAWAIPKTC